MYGLGAAVFLCLCMSANGLSVGEGGGVGGKQLGKEQINFFLNFKMVSFALCC